MYLSISVASLIASAIRRAAWVQNPKTHFSVSPRRRVKPSAGVIVLWLAFTGCGDGMLHEYLNADSSIWTNTPVYVDSTGHAEITVQVEGDHPHLTVYYGCEEYDIGKLYKINADLIVDGKVITPEKDNLNASYSTMSKDMPTSNCCDSLNEMLGMDSTQYMDSYTFGISLTKEYNSLTDLPKQLSVRFTSETAGGNSDTTIVLSLRSHKDTRAPIRFH